MREATAGGDVAAPAKESEAEADAREYRKTLAPGGTLLCAVAPFDARGGLSYVIAALKDLPEIRAVCLGEGAGRDILERLIEDLQLDHRVALMSLPPGRHRWRALRASDLLVLPSLDVVALGAEAMAEARRCRRGIIATDVYGFRVGEPATREGVAIKRASERSLVSAIRRQVTLQSDGR